ncbi:hypothetical protein QBC43DRAFT_306381 [Cladorrhinum sp. PSN259]|nr:hypothetical protein QBC43DRAFT_306381 [Cladorrhinum sp. PSN259]
MWAGGSMKWYNDKPLKVGDEVEEVTRIASAVAKKSKSRNSANGGGDDMVLVDVEKSLFDSDRNLCLVDRRSWIFRKPLATLSQPSPDYSTSRNSSPPESYKTEIRDDPDKGIRHFRFSPVSLFRFSALTFNAHMIHYNEAWTRQREGHPNVVVHGPLNLINVVDFWRDSFSSHKKVGTEHKAMMEQLSQHEVTVTYRALAPIYAGERFTMEMSTPPRVGKEEGHDNDGRNVIAVKKKKKTVGEDRVGEVEEEVVCMTAEIAWVLPGPAPGIND